MSDAAPTATASILAEPRAHAYTVGDLERMLGVSARVVRSLIRAGLVTPQPSGGYTFQDLILMRTAGALRRAGVSGRTLNRTLRELRAGLPGELPLSGLAIAASGSRIAVREGRSHWDADSGQYLLALDMHVDTGSLRFLAQAPDRSRAEQAEEHFKEGYSSEADDTERAIAAYERCLALHGEHREARLNLGRLLHATGRWQDAARVYGDAAGADCDALFNLGVVLEDLGQHAAAVDAYRRALAVEPACADAHYNLARLHDAAGRPQESLRHLLAYRRLLPQRG